MSRSALGTVALLFGLTLILTSVCCTGSEPLPGLGEEFDLGALTGSVSRLCSATQCGDYSQDECNLFLPYDSLMWVRLSEDPDDCFERFVSYIDCLADAQDCSAESCDEPYEACAATEGAPNILVPEAVEPAVAKCEWGASCAPPGVEPSVETREARCLAEIIAEAELSQNQRGPGCAAAYIDAETCIGESDPPCTAQLDRVCMAEWERFYVTCYPEYVQ